MKLIYPLIACVLLCGCIRKSSIEFAGKAPGIKSGVFIIKTARDSTMFGENIKDEKFSVIPQQFKRPGYYTMSITDDNDKDKHSSFEIYLEGGKYTVETEAGKLYKYPKITSTSKTQTELSAFYELSDKSGLAAELEAQQLNAEIKAKGRAMSQTKYVATLNKITDAENKMIANNINAFKEFVKQYPNSEVSTHIMSRLTYEDDPATYYAIFKTLSPAAQNSDDGKEIGDKLSHMIKLVVGATAPALVGKMPDGKPFDPKTLGKKFILVDFWKAGNDFSRQTHSKFATILMNLKDKSKLGIVSVSLDSKLDWWMSGISGDNMTWPQVSDLKGDESQNAVNWSITKIPTYYLLDSNWKIVERNIEIGNVDFEVSDYVSKH